MIDYIDESVAMRIVQSMAFARLQGAFLSAVPLQPGQMSCEAKQELVSAVALFFNLDSCAASAILAEDDYKVWAQIIVRSLREQKTTNVTFHTSGSTGVPSPHVFSADDIEVELRALEPHFTGRQRIVSVMPVHHVFGFIFALMLPRYMDIPFIHKPPLPTADFFSSLMPGDLVLAFPIFWKSFLDMNWPDMQPDIHGVSSAAPCPPAVIERLIGRAGKKGILSTMTEIYGATEFGAIGIRTECTAPYILLEHWQRVPLHSQNENDNSAWGIQRSYGSPLPLPDAITWEDENHFVPLRRKDYAVQVGGFNVYLLQVAETLKEFPAVEDCAVRLMRPEEGSRLKAFIVLRPNVSPSAMLVRELRHWLAARLAPPAMPKSFRFGHCLPHTPSGKLCDWNITDETCKEGI